MAEKLLFGVVGSLERVFIRTVFCFGGNLLWWLSSGPVRPTALIIALKFCCAFAVFVYRNLSRVYFFSCLARLNGYYRRDRGGVGIKSCLLFLNIQIEPLTSLSI